MFITAAYAEVDGLRDMLTARISEGARRRIGAWDRLGISLSGVCLLHCLLVPVVLAMLPLWPFAEQMHAWLHPLFAVVLVPVTLVALRAGYRQHGSRPVAVLLLAGLSVILAAGALGHAVPGAPVETLVTLVGSGLLIAGHWMNVRACRACVTHSAR